MFPYLLIRDQVSNIFDGHGNTPLTTALLRDKEEVAELLIAKGANICQIDHVGNSPLNLIAERYGWKAIIFLMIENGINARDKDGETTLHKMIEFGNFELAKMLISRSWCQCQCSRF